MSTPREKLDAPKQRNIAIVGTTEHKGEAPYGDTENWEIWNHANVGIPRQTRRFELHDPLLIQATYPHLWKSLIESEGTYETYLRPWEAPHPQIKNSHPFPRDLMIQMFGKFFFTSSAAWMMAYAISLKPKEIGLFGIDMSTDPERIHQQQGVYHFITMAFHRGIALRVPEGSHLLKASRMYAMDDEWELVDKLNARHTELKDKLDEVNAKQEQMKFQGAMLLGALQNTDWLIANG